MSAHRVPLVDLGWLTLESRDTPMHVGGLLIFELPAGAEPGYMRKLVAWLRDVESCASPWNLSLANGWSRLIAPRFEAEEVVDLEYHVWHLALPAPGGERELGELISRVHGNPLDLGRPLWECFVIEGLENDRFALFIKIHHALIDGVAGLRMIQRALEKQSPPWAQDLTKQAQKRSSGSERPKSSFTSHASPLVAREKRPGFFASVSGVYPVLRPRAALPDGLVPAFAAPNSVLNARIRGQRRVSTQCYSLTQIKAMAAKAEVSVNDIVLAVCAGGLRGLLHESGALPKKPLTACIPINIRAKDDIGIGTAISFGFANLATHVPDPLRRLRLIHQSTQAIKRHVVALPRTNVNAFTLAVMGPFLLQQMVGLGGRSPPMFNLTISNVPGPEDALYLFGARLQALYPASVLFHGQALNITCVRYGDYLNFGFTAWRDAVGHAQRIAVYCGEAFSELADALK